MPAIKLADCFVQGSRINYQYSIPAELKKYFSRTRLFADYGDADISKVPQSIAAIPFVANMVPVSWFIPFNIVVPELDRNFYHSMMEIKEAFAKQYQQVKLSESKLLVDRLVDNDISPQTTALMFSEGVDSFASFLMHRHEPLHLITVHGADIRLHDQTQFDILKLSISSNDWIRGISHHVVRSNIRDFYSYRIPSLFEDLDWWGRVQHGLSLTSLAAPLSFVYGFEKLLLASSTTGDFKLPWGSSPETDNLVRWASLTTRHDGFEMKRSQKVDMIVNETKQAGKAVHLKVCYSNRHSSLNCSHCDKCLRTILQLICSGANPNQYGFDVNASVYNEIKRELKKGNTSAPDQYMWNDLADTVEHTTRPFIFNDRNLEAEQLREIVALIRNNNKLPVAQSSALVNFRRRLQLRYPSLLQKAVSVYRRFVRQ